MAQKLQDKNPIMEQLLEHSPPIVRATPGEIIEGTVIHKGKNKLLLDINGTATGIISGRELRDSFHTFHDIAQGSSVTAMVLEEENDEGMIVMSLRRASQQKAWDRFHKLVAEEGTMSFVAQEANKGGLLANIDGIRTFLPVSQLAPVNYPRVNNADSHEIISRLQKFVGRTFIVKIITMDEDAGKIVVSEREALAEERAKSLESLRVGDVRDGMVSGIVKFGVFVAFDGLEGLVHISEIAWGHVRNPSEHVKVGDQVQVKVIGMEGEKLSLSMKQLTPDPWELIAENYPVGKQAHGTVTKFTDYGAFVKLEKDINGLVHLSEIAHRSVNDPAEALTIGQKVDVQVINIDPDERRIGLSIKALQPITKEMLEQIQAEEAAMQEGEQTKDDAQKPSSEEVTQEPVSTEETEEVEENADATPEDSAEEEKAPEESSDGFVASKTGKKYYLASSASAKKIKEENRVTFATAEEAEKAGYTA